MTFKTALLALPLAGALLTPAAALTPADRAWIATCIDQLKPEKQMRTAVRRYCTCMHGYFDDDAKISQSEMEHMFPPAHRACSDKAGWRR